MQLYGFGPFRCKLSLFWSLLKVPKEAQTDSKGLERLEEDSEIFKLKGPQIASSRFERKDRLGTSNVGVPCWPKLSLHRLLEVLICICNQIIFRENCLWFYGLFFPLRKLEPVSVMSEVLLQTILYLQLKYTISFEVTPNLSLNT